MAHKVTYQFDGAEREISFSYSEFHNMHEAAAAAEGVDIKQFLKREQEILAITNDKMAARDFRDAEFEKMGFDNLYFHKNGDKPD
ncbi:MAG: DUF2960 family protein [Sinobacterium sp.]|nr:DUF2960 family protein [Sinobacterium sp.]